MSAPASAAERAYLYGKPYRKLGPQRDFYVAPATGEATAAAFDAAIESLRAAKGSHEGDVAARLHLVASLLAEVASRLPGALAAARAKSLCWAQVADLAATTRASAWGRYARGSSERPSCWYVITT